MSAWIVKFVLHLQDFLAVCFLRHIELLSSTKVCTHCALFMKSTVNCYYTKKKLYNEADLSCDYHGAKKLGCAVMSKLGCVLCDVM